MVAEMVRAVARLMICGTDGNVQSCGWLEGPAMAEGGGSIHNAPGGITLPPAVAAHIGTIPCPAPMGASPVDMDIAPPPGSSGSWTG